MKKIILTIAYGFGFGLSPKFSGTTGAFVGLPLAIAITALHGYLWIQIIVAALLTLLAIPICDYAEKHSSIKDDDRIVADEYMLLPICFVGQEPVFYQLFGSEPDIIRAILFIGMAFVISRIFDILKLYPANRLQRAPGGYGIVLDDLFADIYALPCIWLCNKFILIPIVLPFVNKLFA
ncbi:MAG: phosphatidylglycerophosphatase A [Kiritimatiellae bacterium]|nr:phosphatidylglycerophosphatase A [Kiritimatiellia bacterium]